LHELIAREFGGRVRGVLNAPSVGVPPACALRALRAATERWAAGAAQPADYDADVERTRASFARICRVPTTAVSLGAQVSYFVGLVASSLAPGAEVVAYERDFASVLFPFLARGDLRVKMLDDVDALPDAITPRTALVAVSAVQSADGRTAPLQEIRRAARASGTMTLVDTTQAAGWLPLDAGGFDVTVCAAYKWLLCPRGVAAMTIAPERIDWLRPLAAGWYAGENPWTSVYGPRMELASDARRFDVSPAWMSFTGAAPALELIERLGVERIHARVLALANGVRDRLGQAPDASPILSLPAPGAAERLAAAGISCAVRAGRARVGLHFYNDEEDSDRLVSAVLAPSLSGQ